MIRTIFKPLAATVLALCGAHAAAADTLARDVLEIQNLQGRYLHYLNSARMDKVPGLFAQHDPGVDVDLPGGKARGLAGVAGEFEKLRDMVAAQGGFMGTHLATTPVVVVAKDGRTARGSWMSIGFTVMGPAFAPKGAPAPQPPYPTLVTVGRYDHTFAKEGGHWKILHFKWSIFASLPAIQYDPATAGPGWANRPMVPGTPAAPWALPPENDIQ